MSRQPHLLMVSLNYAPEPTGIAPYARDLAERSVARGVPVTVITTFPHYPQWRLDQAWSARGFVVRETINGVSLIRLRPLLPSRLSTLRRALMEIVFGLMAWMIPWRDVTQVVLVSPALLASSLLALKARLKRLPHTIWVQDIYSLGAAQTGQGGRLQPLLTRAEARTFQHCRDVVVIHDRFAQALSSRLGVHPKSLRVVRNWTHLRTAPSGDRAKIRLDFGWAAHQTVVLHAGAIGAKQGLENVVSAAAIASGRAPGLRFVLLGDGTRRTALELLPDSRHVEFLDPLPDEQFALAMQAADILLVSERPGLTEMSVPSKLTTYFAAARPVVVVADQSSVTAEEIETSRAGVRVDPASPLALVDAVVELAADGTKKQALVDAGLEFVKSELARDRLIDLFLSGLQGLEAAGKAGHFELDLTTAGAADEGTPFRLSA